MSPKRACWPDRLVTQIGVENLLFIRPGLNGEVAPRDGISDLSINCILA
jgi:hypothetical protein